MFMGHPAYAWVVFGVALIAMFAMDVFFLNNNRVSYKTSLVISLLHVVASLAFGMWIKHDMGAQSAGEYVTGYLLEKSLSVDSLFVIVMIFDHLCIPPKNQSRVLLWGILGAIFMRAALIVPGSVLVAQFHWVLYIFAVFLVFTGMKILVLRTNKKEGLENNKLLKWMRGHMRITDGLHGDKFMVRLAKGGRLYFTPLFVALVLVEFADVVFAVDSISAIFAVTTDTFVIYSSNIFAVMGLRSLYIVLSGVIHRFAYLKQALALLLIFIGLKIFVADLFNVDVPISLSLGVITALLSGGVIYSIYRTNLEDK